MERKKILFSSIIITLICLMSFSTRPPRGRTGAPDELSCSAIGCHNTNPAFDGEFEFSGFPSALVAGQSFEVSLTMRATQGSPIKAGFQMVGLGRVNGQLINVGEFTNAGPGAIIANINGRNYIEHDGAANFNANGTVTYTAMWSTPNSFPTDTVTLYVAGVLGNNNGENSGDHVIFGSRAMPVNNATDADNDGFGSDIDCDDMNADINPDAQEIPNNDVDENCDGEILRIDQDMDGFNSDDDCDDTDFNIKPSALEIPNNDVDENCDGIVLVIDDDNDGFNSDEDCDDQNPDANPGAQEIANNDVDENCDGIVLVIDEDSDGFNSDEDCDDQNENIFPGAPDTAGNNIDENCDGVDGTLSLTLSAVILNINNDPVSGVAVIDTVTKDTLAFTDASGKFSIISTTQNAVIGFYKEGRPAEGLTSTDIVLITNHILQRGLFTKSLQPAIADVNGSGSVSATDIVLIKNVLLQRIESFGSRDIWNFEPRFITPTNASETVSIKAYKLGDVNGSGSN